MRNPARITGLLDALERVWQENPDLRLCQLLQACTGQAGPVDMYYVEEEQIMYGLNYYLTYGEFPR